MQNRLMKMHAAASFRFVFFIACFSFFISNAYAQDWLLSTADFHIETVALKSIDEKGVHVVDAGQTRERVVTPEAFLQIDRAAGGAVLVEKPAKFMLELVTGDRVGGEPVKVENDRLTWRNATVGELSIPLSQLSAIAKPGRGAPPDFAKRTEDVVTLANGDAVRGIVVSMSANQVQVKAGGPDDAPTNASLDSVVSIQFASTGPASKPVGSDKIRAYRVRLEDGSSLVGTSLTVSGDKLSLVIGNDGKGDARPIDLASVAGIEQVNGPVSWLTSRQPVEDVQIPFVGTSEQAAWKTRIDTDVAGQPLVIGGQTFKRGIGVHAYSRLVYPLDGTYKAFRTRYGINDTLLRSDVTVRIRVDDKLVHEKKNVRPGAASPVVAVELGSAKQLVLEVDYGEGIDVEDRLNWIEPALLREMPKPEAAPTTRPATLPAASQPASSQPAAATKPVVK